jgi:hypothetical protein
MERIFISVFRKFWLENLFTESSDMDASKCSTDSDMLTHVNWMDKDPTIFIDFRNEEDIGHLNCYDGDTLKEWLRISENIFIREIKGHTWKYAKLYTGEYILYDKAFENIVENQNEPIILVAVSSNIPRMGNNKIYYLIDKYTALNNLESTIASGELDTIEKDIKRYITIANDRDMRGLPLKMMFSFNVINGGFAENADRVFDIYNRLVDSEYQSNIVNDDEILNVSSAMQEMEISLDPNVVNVSCGELINQLFKKGLPKNVIPEMYVIELVVRQGLNLNYLERYASGNDIMLNQLYSIALKRAVLIDSSHLREVIPRIEKGEWGIPNQAKLYKRILKQDEKEDDTYDNMIQFYSDLQDTFER